MDIVLARREDLPAIVEIVNWAAAHTPANFATEPEPEAMWTEAWERTARMHPWLVARDEGRVMGFAKSSPHHARGAYAWTADVTVYVHPDHHRRGVGKALYERLIPTLRAQGYVMLLAGITTPNPASEALHRAFGFVRCGNFPRAGWKFGRWHDVSWWSLELHGEEAPSPVRPVAEALAT